MPQPFWKLKQPGVAEQSLDDKPAHEAIGFFEHLLIVTSKKHPPICLHEVASEPAAHGATAHEPADQLHCGSVWQATPSVYAHCLAKQPFGVIVATWFAGTVEVTYVHI